MKAFKLGIIALFIMVGLAMPVYAQEVTPEPTAIVVDPPPTFINAENGISVSTIVYGVIIALLSGGTLAVVITRFGSNKANLDALEKLYQSMSPETQEIWRERFVELEGIANRLLEIVDKVTDGDPDNSLKQ